MVLINDSTTVSEIRKELRNGEAYYHVAKGFSFAG
jgi:hypothetical protein